MRGMETGKPAVPSSYIPPGPVVVFVIGTARLARRSRRSSSTLVSPVLSQWFPSWFFSLQFSVLTEKNVVYSWMSFLIFLFAHNAVLPGHYYVGKDFQEFRLCSMRAFIFYHSHFALRSDPSIQAYVTHTAKVLTYKTIQKVKYHNTQFQLICNIYSCLCS